MTSARPVVALGGAPHGALGALWQAAVSALTLVAVCCTSGRAAADPQWHVGLSPGGCLVHRSGSDQDFAWCGSVSSHLLFLRQRDSDFGLGPYARVLGILGDSASASAGLSALLPLSPTYPFIISLGAVAASHDNAANAGAAAWLFWGPTSYNFHSSYSMASGLLIGAQKTWGTEPTTVLAFAAQLDLVLVAMPFIFLFEVLRGPPER
jgi:hypothetical protein